MKKDYILFMRTNLSINIAVLSVKQNHKVGAKKKKKKR